MAEKTTTKKPRSFPKLPPKAFIALIVFGVLLIAIAPAYYFYLQYQHTQQLLKSPAELQKEETQMLIDKVGKLIELPKDEDPTIATVSDKTKLMNQSFFQNAENGDKVLIFTKVKKAILYRPSVNKIIDVTTVNIGSSQASPKTTPTAAPTGSTKATPTPAKKIIPTPSAKASPTPASVSVALYNGTQVTGLARTIETRLKPKVPNMTVSTRTNASGNYTTTVVVDLSGGTHKAEAAQIAKVLGVTVTTTMPKGETKPATTDILVIIGTDNSQ